MYWIYTKIEKYGPQLRSPELNDREKVRFRNKKQNLNEFPVYQAWMIIIMDISRGYNDSYGPMNLDDCTYMIKGLNLINDFLYSNGFLTFKSLWKLNCFLSDYVVICPSDT